MSWWLLQRSHGLYKTLSEFGANKIVEHNAMCLTFGLVYINLTMVLLEHHYCERFCAPNYLNQWYLEKIHLLIALGLFWAGSLFDLFPLVVCDKSQERHCSVEVIVLVIGKTERPTLFLSVLVIIRYHSWLAVYSEVEVFRNNCYTQPYTYTIFSA